MKRRDLLAAAFATIAARITVSAVQKPAAHEPRSGPAALAASDGELVYVGRDPVRIKVSAAGAPARFAMITQEVSPGTVIPIHAHDREDEIIFIQSGTGVATLGDHKVTLGTGSTLFVPQGTWHGGRNTGTGILRWIAI